MNKEKIIIEFKNNILRELKKVQQQIDLTNTSYKQSPSVMQSASDTSRSSLEWEINNYNKTKTKLIKLINKLDIIVKQRRDTEVGEGSLVKIAKNNETTWFLIIDEGNGKKIRFENDELIYAISKDTPIAKCIMGLSKGDKKEQLGEIIEVKKIY